MKTDGNSGFTLVEVLIVLVIMAILVGTAVASVGAGMKSAKIRDAARAVQLYARHAKAIALLKQRPVVLTIEEIAEGGEFVKSRISLTYSADSSGSSQERVGVITGADNDGRVRTLSGLVVGEETGEIETAPDTDSGEEAPDPLAAEPREFEGIHLHAVAKEEEEQEMRPRISVFSNADYLKRKSAEQEAKAREKEAAADGTVKTKDDGDKEEDTHDSEHLFEVTYEANGRCEPFVVKIWKDGANEDDAMEMNIGRFGRIVTGD